MTKRAFADPAERIILALDVDNTSAAMDAVSMLKGHVGAFKIGFELFVSEGPAVVQAVKDRGGRVFLDLKFHDIPNTVAKAARAAVRMGVDFFDVHASGGRAMMTSAVEAARDEAKSAGVQLPLSLAVTVLTSLGADDLRDDLNIGKTPEGQVVSLARLSRLCGMAGVVASPKEIRAIRDAVGADFTIVTPGVRPAWSETQDQKRVATPAEAISAGADYIVVGRPILGAKDSVDAAKRIRDELYGINLA